MKSIYLFILATSLIVLSGCRHKVELPENQVINLSPTEAGVSMGPVHKRIEVRSPRNNKKLLDIDVWEDEREIEFRKDAQDVRIRHR